MPLAGPLRFPGTRCPGEQGPGPFHDLVRPTLCFCWPWAFLLSTGLTAKPMSFLGLALGRVTRRDHPLSSPQGPLLRWLKVNFSEAFIAWIHIKALRVFVESVLRYGLPVNFQAVLLQPHKKSSTKRLREVLNSVFRHLDEVAAASILDASVEIPGLQLNNQDYFPYVYFHIDLSLLD